MRHMQLQGWINPLPLAGQDSIALLPHSCIHVLLQIHVKSHETCADSGQQTYIEPYKLNGPENKLGGKLVTAVLLQAAVLGFLHASLMPTQL